MDDQLPGGAQMAQGAARLLGRDRVALEPLSPGSSRGAARVVSAEGEPLAFVRYDLGIASSVGIGKALAGEIGIVERAHALGFPVPRVFGMIDKPLAAIMELAAGTSRPSAEEAEQVGAEFMGHIARIHALSPAQFGVETFPTLKAAVLADLAAYEQDARTYGTLADPLVRLAFALLRATVPDSPEAPAMLHGDVGAGNFMVHDGRVSAILDWELAHAGDIHEDLAWLWVRGAHTAFGDPAVRLAEYVAAGGRRPDPSRLAWHVAFVTLKSVVGLGRRLYGSEQDPGLLTIEIGILAYQVLLSIALGTIVGVDVTALEESPVSRPSRESTMIEVLALLEPPSSRESQVLAAYLKDGALQREWRDARFGQDCARLLGIRPDELGDRLDCVQPEELPAWVSVLGAAAWRRCKASPNAERRVRRALDIGYGRVGDTTK